MQNGEEPDCGACKSWAKTDYAERIKPPWSAPYISNLLQKNQFILDEACGDPWVAWMISNRQNAVDGFSFRKAFCDEVLNKGLMGGEQEIAEFEGGGAPWPITYTFLPDEL